MHIQSHTKCEQERFAVSTDEWLLSLVSGMPSHKRANHKVLMLQAFIDESGTHADTPICVLGGYVSTVERWAAFTDVWTRTLQEEPAISHFHAADMLGMRNQFKGWSKEQVRTKLRALTKIIGDHVVCGVFSTVVPEDYEKVLGEHRINKFYKDPYIYCLCNLLRTLNVASEQEIEGGKSISVVLDEIKGVGYRALEVFNSLHKDKSPFICTVRFGNDRIEPPLQAADLFAWRCRVRSAEGRENYYLEDEYKPLRHINSYVSDRSEAAVEKDIRTFVLQLEKHYPA